MATDTARLHAVLAAAEALLHARQRQMLTVEEWVRLARAVAVCGGQETAGLLTADLLTPRDLEEVTEEPRLAWEEAVDGALPGGDDD